MPSSHQRTLCKTGILYSYVTENVVPRTHTLFNFMLKGMQMQIHFNLIYFKLTRVH